MSIASEIQRLQGAKTDITTAIANKGVTIPAGTTLDGYDDYIAQIQTGGTYQSKTVTPNAAGQTVSPDQGYDALSSVVINGDQNLVAGNVKKDVTIFGVTGSYESTPNLQEKTVVPVPLGTTVYPDSGYDGLSQVGVMGDKDLIAENIKQGVDIFGVTGTLVSDDFSTLGTTITAQATSTVTKGQRWEGEENSQIDYTMTITSYSNAYTSYFRTSKDCDVGIKFNTSVTSATTEYPVYFRDKANQTYNIININIASAIQALELDVLENASVSYTICASINETGTLIKIAVNANTQLSWAGSYKFIVIEVDKENKSGTAYVQTLSFTPYYLNGDRYVMLGNYIIIPTTSTQNAEIFRYSTTTHTLSSLGRYSSYYLMYFWQNINSMYKACAWVSENKVIVHIGDTSKLIAFTFNESSALVQGSETSTLGNSQNYQMSGDGVYFTNLQSYTTINVGIIDPSDLSVTFYASISVQDQGRLAYGNLLMAYTGGTIKLYKIEANQITYIKDLSNLYYFYSNRTCPFYNITQDTFYLDSSNPRIWKLNIIGAEFIISPNNGTTTTGKYYGIASKTIEAGEQDTTQLLFTT